VTTQAALIVAAGRGSRARGADGLPKQYERLGGVPVLARTLHAFVRDGTFGHVQVVIHPDDAGHYAAAAAGLTLLPPVHGGATRQASVLAGLEALAAYAPAPTRVLIHDAARPFVTSDLISRVLSALDSHPGALAAEPLADTLKRSNPDGTVGGTIDRAGLWRAQTPQGFHFAPILKAHRDAAAAGLSNFTDDAAIAEWAGLAVQLVAGPSTNAKLTTSEDLIRANRTMTNQPSMSRTGLGFDVHAFAPGDHVWLGGVRIPHTARLDGHSDADVVLHALTDALLGAIGDGDIGQHFPPSDPQWKGAASILFLADAVRRVRARGGVIVHADITILAEVPRIGPHRPAMQQVIAAALGIGERDVGIKATTTETLGFVGRREGLAAMAVATVALPAG
jgi:2-C-methyl-D-erythritol 4-phosphate cytidylyltransferase / 2-C-methyl-D-erythritol 2,4-cyclodiphosphate synthase